MKVQYLFFFFILTFNNHLFSQNKAPELEGKYDVQSETLPDWVQLMYAENPDIGVVMQGYETYYETNDFVKNKHTQYYKRWLRNLRYDPDGYASGTKSRKAVRNNREAYLAKVNAQKSLPTKSLSSNWECIGPFDYDPTAASTSYAPGSAHVYTVEKSVSSPNTLYAGTATAGVWKTIDNGQNWTLLTRDLLINGVRSIEIDHTNANTAYFGGGGYVYKTTDGGSTWNIIGGASFESSDKSVNDLVMHPTDAQKLWAACEEGLYYSSNAGATFSQLHSGIYQEIEFNPSNASTMYAVKQVADRTEFHKSLDGGQNFVLTGTGWPNASAPDEQKRTEIAVTPANPNKIYALATGSANGGSGLYGIYVSNDQGDNWTRTCCGPQVAGVPDATNNQNLMGWSDLGDDDGGQYYYDLALDVSPTDEDSLIVGGVNVWYSADGGATFDCPSKWSHSDKSNYVHADIHDIRYFGGEIWIACDGGIYTSSNGGFDYSLGMHGIAGTDFWGFGAGYWDGEVMLGGTYHNATLLKDNNVYQNGWLATGGGDNTFGEVNYGNERLVYFDYGERCLSGDANVELTNKTFSLSLSGDVDFAFDPRSFNTIYMGEDNVLMKTENDGASFTALHTFPAKIYDIAVSWANPDIIYITTDPGFWDKKKIWKSTNAGINWQDVTPTAAEINNNYDYIRYDVDTDSNDPNVVWAARKFYWSDDPAMDGYQVLKSVDGGNTWQAYGGSVLDGESATNIVHQRGTDGGVYVGTKRAVYYRNNAMSDWVIYNSDLPLSTHSTRLVPHYRKGVIRNATNRSIYEVDLYEQTAPSAQISVDKMVSNCVRDTFQFLDHSALNETGATWAWQFPGGTPATSNIRNPKVLYDTPGMYEVTLTVSDVNGSDTQILSDLIMVTNDCTMDTIPGKVLTLQNSGDYAVIPPLKMGTTNEFTMAAWIKPNGIQGDYTGMIIGDGGNGAFGFNFRPNNELAYHWPGGQWWWSSGLTVPSNEWSHVAIVINTNSITLYLNGVGVTHNVTPEAIDLDNTEMLLGSYLGWGGRNFKGFIDEVKIWNRSLTTDELREKMHITAYETETDLVAYYQFNSNSVEVMDRMNTFHAAMVGNAARTGSTAPVGGGVAVTDNINSGGIKFFGATGLGLGFPTTGTFPNGNVVVSRINWTPDELPSTSPISRSYWVVRNYGANASFSPLTAMYFDGIGWVGNNQDDFPEIFELYKRDSNADGTTWGTNIDLGDDAVVGMDGSVSFTTALNVTSFSQFVISNTCATTNTDANANNIPDACEASDMSLSLLLEGAYDVPTGLMRTELAQQNVLPLQQPYANAPFNYTGTETLSSIPANMVDWVLVEVKSDVMPTTMFDRKAALLLNDGSIVELDGTSPLRFDLPYSGDFYYVVRHRNHLPVMTANAVSKTPTMTYDFSDSLGKAFGLIQMAQTNDARFALYAGDITQDFTIQTTDYDFWKANAADLQVYDNADVNLDSVIQTTDYDLWYRNRSILTPPEVGY